MLQALSIKEVNVVLSDVLRAANDASNTMTKTKTCTTMPLQHLSAVQRNLHTRFHIVLHCDAMLPGSFCFAIKCTTL